MACGFIPDCPQATRRREDSSIDREIPMTLVGAAVTPKSGQTWQAAIAEFESATGRTMPVRRCYNSAPPSSLGASQMQYDLGVRASVWSIKPSITTPISTLESLASSIVAAAHPCDVIIYHEPVDNFPDPDDFIALYQRSAPPLRDAGVPVGVCYTNWSVNLPYTNSQSALRHYWPGDELVDFLAVDEYPAVPPTNTPDYTAMTDRTRRASQFADARGIPLGLAEFGVDATWDVSKSDKWLRSVTDWARLRAAEGVPLRWACYFSSDVGGNWWINNKAEYVDAYTDCYRTV